MARSPSLGMLHAPRSMVVEERPRWSTQEDRGLTHHMALSQISELMTTQPMIGPDRKEGAPQASSR